MGAPLQAGPDGPFEVAVARRAGVHRTVHVEARCARHSPGDSAAQILEHALAVRAVLDLALKALGVEAEMNPFILIRAMTGSSLTCTGTQSFSSRSPSPRIAASSFAFRRLRSGGAKSILRMER